MSEKVQLNIRLDKDLMDAVKDKAAESRRSITEFTVELFEKAVGRAPISEDEVDRRIAESLAPLQQKIAALEQQLLGELVA